VIRKNGILPSSLPLRILLGHLLLISHPFSEEKFYESFSHFTSLFGYLFSPNPHIGQIDEPAPLTRHPQTQQNPALF